MATALSSSRAERRAQGTSSGAGVCHVTTVDMSLKLLLLNQLQSIRDDGFDVTGISSPGPDVPEVEAAGVRHIAVPMTRSPLTPFRDLVTLWRLYRTFRAEDFTIVHTHTPKPGLLGQLAARAAGVPVVVNTLHGFYFHDHTPELLRRFYILIEKVSACCSDVILSQNSEDIGTAVGLGICDADRIEPLGNGIDVRRFDRSRISDGCRAALRRELGIPEEAPVVGFVGRLVHEKGLPELFEATRQLATRVPDLRLLLVGPVDTEKQDALSPETAREYGIEETCVFTGLRRDTPELYSLMDVFALPSHREGFPRAPMEASSMGVPCVVTDIRGCRETVEHGRNGFLVPLQDASALADAILRLLADREIARCMGREGARMARERFDERSVFDKVKSEYRRLLEEKGLPGPEPRATGSPGHPSERPGHAGEVPFNRDIHPSDASPAPSPFDAHPQADPYLKTDDNQGGPGN